VVEGWIPKSNIKDLYRHMTSAAKQKFIVEEVDDGDTAPTMLSRPRMFSQFDYLMGFYSLPMSNEIDPTWFFIVSFMIFYGMMVSDVGYGILSLIIATILVKKFPEEGLMNSVARVWQLAAIPIMIFGVLSNQFFGIALAPFKGVMVIDWINNVPGLLVFTLLLGVAQVIIGLVIGFVNKVMHHEKKLAVSKLTSILAVITGMIAIAGGLFGVMSNWALPAAVIAVFAAIATMALSGIEAVEFTSLISHPLSYTRIFGFGLASIVLASLIDKAFTPTFSGGIGGAISFIIVAIIFLALHTMNMLLSIFEGIVQATRLNFVEFFTKFYTGGGSKFTPYKYNRRYTKE
jgi:V/A-type H+-transporting ATPase subunit I